MKCHKLLYLTNIGSETPCYVCLNVNSEIRSVRVPRTSTFIDSILRSHDYLKHRQKIHTLSLSGKVHCQETMPPRDSLSLSAIDMLPSDLSQSLCSKCGWSEDAWWATVPKYATILVRRALRVCPILSVSTSLRSPWHSLILLTLLKAVGHNRDCLCQTALPLV